METNRKYACPYCESEQIEPVLDDKIDNRVRITYICEKCGKEFYQWYSMKYENTTYN